MPPISPGVYTKIIDLSEYVQNVPSTIGFIAIVSERGPDNRLVFTNARDFYLDFGEPNITYLGSLGKQYGQGPYVASSFLKQSDSLYVIRVLPTDEETNNPASYANLVFAVKNDVLEDSTNNPLMNVLNIPDKAKVVDIQYFAEKSSINTFSSSLFGYTDLYFPYEENNGTLNLSPIPLVKPIDVTSIPFLSDSTGIDTTGYTFAGENRIYLGRAAIGLDGIHYTLTDSTYIFDTSNITWDSTNSTITVVNETGSRTFYLENVESVNIADNVVSINFKDDAIIHIPVYILEAFPRNIKSESDARKIIKSLIRDYYLYLLNDETYKDLFEVRPVLNLNSASEFESVLGTGTLDLNNTLDVFNKNADGSGRYSGLFIIFGVGRGQWYNNFRIRITPHNIPMKALENIYVLEIEKKQKAMDYDSATKSWVETFEVVQALEICLDPNKVDDSGDSLFIVDVLNNYFRYLKADIAGEGDDESAMREKIAWLDALIKKIKSKFAVVDVEYESPLDGSTKTTQYDFSDLFDFWTKDTFVGAERLGGGSDGDINDPEVLKQLLVKAYSGLLKKAYKETGDPAYVNPVYVDEVLNTEDYYFNIVMDAGYPTEVKNAIVSLCRDARKDCIAILDNGDNRTTSEALDKRLYVNTYNTFYAALYECYTKIYDVFTGKDIWVTPVYHMASIIPYTENVAELWYAPAGFNRATIDGIKSMRFSPRQGERDQFYLNQINPIVRFNVGFTVWGQLTTQKRPTAMQNINIVRLVLYIKRALEQFCKFYIFELNDETTWNAVKRNIELFLEEIKTKRGLYDYKVEVGATEYEIKKKIMHVNVTLNPVRVVEQIHLNFFIV